MIADHPGTLHGGFERRVASQPDATALEHEGRRLSYAELNRAANRLAHYLRDTVGVCPDDGVALLARDPLNLITGMLAVLKSGGAYTPLDPDNPPGLTRRTLDHLDPKAVLVESDTVAGAAFFGGELFVLDVMADELPAADLDPKPAAAPTDLAYVMYTSGTTGAPRGVAVEHRAIVNTVTWRTAYYGFGPGDVTLAVPSPSFDSSVEDVFCALTSGAALLFPVRERVTDRRYLAGLIADGRISHFLITPALYRRLLPGIEPDACDALRSVTLAGEWFTRDLVRDHYHRLPRVRLFNEYGPCENAVCSTVHPLVADDDRVLIGRPIENTRAYLLGEDGTPVEPGAVGEIHLAGAGLARGYLGDAQLTAERFALHRPPGAEPERVYRTGDLARARPDGNLEFVGRRDRQLKLRGRRIEPGQVAECLAADASVDEAYVLHHGAESATPRLVAFVVGPGTEVVGRLAAQARRELPSYMVPAAIVPIPALPLTSHGKVDERALADEYERLLGRPGPPSQDVGQVEACLLELWRRILDHDSIGLDDDFFHLGGDSLGVMDLVAGVEQELGVRLGSAEAYVGRTIRTLARTIEDLQQDGASTT